MFEWKKIGLFPFTSPFAVPSSSLFPVVSPSQFLILRHTIPNASAALIVGSCKVCSPGEKPLCQRRRGALFVAACSFPTRALKNGKQPAAGKNVADGGNGSPMSTGDHCIRITFAACIRSRRKPMEPEPSTRNNTATKTPSMFDETPP